MTMIRAAHHLDAPDHVVKLAFPQGVQFPVFQRHHAAQRIASSAATSSGVHPRFHLDFIRHAFPLHSQLPRLTHLAHLVGQ